MKLRQILSDFFSTICSIRICLGCETLPRRHGAQRSWVPFESYGGPFPIRCGLGLGLVRNSQICPRVISTPQLETTMDISDRPLQRSPYWWNIPMSSPTRNDHGGGTHLSCSTARREVAAKVSGKKTVTTTTKVAEEYLDHSVLWKFARIKFAPFFFMGVYMKQ